MKQSWDEYVEGRLTLGGCGLAVIFIGIIIYLIVLAVEYFTNDFSVWKLIILIFAVLSIIAIIVNAVKGKD